MATGAMFVALGGGAYAVTQIDRNSVESKHIVNGQVKSVDVGPPENWHEVGAPGEPEFRTGDCTRWGNFTSNYNTVGFYRDPYGRVHLKGRVGTACFGAATTVDDIFGLPPGYRPAKEIEFATTSRDAFANLLVKPDGTVAADPPYDRHYINLDNLSFRCAPSGQDGCP
jgi:hypothetical protein